VWHCAATKKKKKKKASQFTLFEQPVISEPARETISRPRTRTRTSGKLPGAKRNKLARFRFAPHRTESLERPSLSIYPFSLFPPCPGLFPVVPPSPLPFSPPSPPSPVFLQSRVDPTIPISSSLKLCPLPQLFLSCLSLQVAVPPKWISPVSRLQRTTRRRKFDRISPLSPLAIVPTTLVFHIGGPDTSQLHPSSSSHGSLVIKCDRWVWVAKASARDMISLKTT